jgi:8-oxo-dGTP pyrophosphatase MutT (NUDIX family)
VTAVLAGRGRDRRRVYFHDPAAPLASGVVPSAFTAVRRPGDLLLLVQRCDSGLWELPGGRVDVGEDVRAAAVRETAEEAGIGVRITGLVGLYSDPCHVVRGVDGLVRQQFAVVLRAEPAGAEEPPRPDGIETRAAAWVGPGELARLPVEPACRMRIAHALSAADHPYFG